MKKSLLAVAAMTAFAGAAQAQSSVTVYGILDVGYVGSSERANVGTNINNQTTNQFGASAEQTSRLGFKGTEDLGGGMNAFFTVETGLTPDTSTVSTWNNRQAFVGLGKKGLGSAAVGTQYTMIHTAVGATDPGQQNNVAGNVIYPSSSGVTQQQENANSNTNSYTVRTNNTLKLASDNFKGFTANAIYVANNKNQDQTTTNAATTGGNTNVGGWGIGLNYTWQKLLVTANYQSFKNETTSSGTAYAINATTGAVTLTNAQDNQQYYGATYDFGILKAYAGYVNRKVSSTLNSSDYASRSAQQIGVRSFITPKVEGWASMGNGRYRTAGTASPTANFNGWQLGSNYWLSKRTNLYAIYGKNQTSQTTSSTGVSSSYALSNYAIGIRHTF